MMPISGDVAAYLTSLRTRNYSENTIYQYRHRFASQVFQLSKDIRMTQELLGHASIVSTAGYAAWDKSAAALITARLP